MSYILTVLLALFGAPDDGERNGSKDSAHNPTEASSSCDQEREEDERQRAARLSISNGF